jgi:hypothetical protein
MLLSWLVLLSSILNGGSPPAAAVPATVAYSDPMPQQWQLNGIKLGEETTQVMGKWGRPSKVASDEWRNECEIWSYKDGKNVGICDGSVSYVQVLANAKKTDLNGKVIPMVITDLRQALGKPEFVADDGWGIIKGQEALKVFIDERGKLVSLDLFTDM